MRSLLAVLLVLLALAYSFCHAMASFDHNENMYVTAGLLISQGKSIYRDFAYLQMPYLPELYGLVYRTTGTEHHLLAARIMNWGFWVIGGAGVGIIVLRICRDRSFALAAALLYAFNPSLLRITIEASNYVLPATLALMQVACVLGAIRSRGNTGRNICLFLAGLMAGLSVGVKLNFLAAVAPFFVLPLLCHPQRDIRTWIGLLIPMIAGFLLALAPAGWLFVHDGWVFMFDNLHFHRLVTTRDLQAGVIGRMNWAGKLSFFRDHVLSEVSIAIAIAVAGAALVLARRTHGGASRESIALTTTAAVALAVTLGAALYMTPIWPQYFAMPVPYLLLLAGCAYALVPPEQRPALSLLMWMGVFVSAATVINLHDVTSARQIHQRWTPLMIERSAAEIKHDMKMAGVTGKVATLQPLFAIEAGLPIYRELATGPFLFDVGDALSDADRRHAIGTSPRTLGQLLDSDPPAAILVGMYKGWATEKSLEDYAIRNHYRRVRLSTKEFAVLYLQTKKSPHVRFRQEIQPTLTSATSALRD